MTIPKSLHTVRVLVVMARELARLRNISQLEALQVTVTLLGYGNADDGYGLIATAQRQLEG